MLTRLDLGNAAENSSRAEYHRKEVPTKLIIDFDSTTGEPIRTVCLVPEVSRGSTMSFQPVSQSSHRSQSCFYDAAQKTVLEVETSFEPIYRVWRDEGLTGAPEMPPEPASSTIMQQANVLRGLSIEGGNFTNQRGEFLFNVGADNKLKTVKHNPDSSRSTPQPALLEPPMKIMESIIDEKEDSDAEMAVAGET